MSTELQPVMVVREFAPPGGELDEDGVWWPHDFVGKKTQKGARCELCGAPFRNYITKGWLAEKPGAMPPMIHHAYPESVNETGPGDNFNVYLSKKAAWERIFCDLIEETDLPRPLARITVEGEWTFPQRFAKGPDQENYRYHTSKFLGDGLQVGGWLTNDRWDMFEFGNAGYVLERGARRLRLTIFPTAFEA